jgi:cysteine synthase A
MVAAAKGYRLILTMPDTMSQERQAMLKAYGAQLELTPGENGMRAAIALAEEMLLGLLMLSYRNSLNNPANPQIHRETTAEEIWADTDGGIDSWLPVWEPVARLPGWLR